MRKNVCMMNDFQYFISSAFGQIFPTKDAPDFSLLSLQIVDYQEIALIKLFVWRDHRDQPKTAIDK